jgi:uncharacterized membrane protein
LESDFPTFPATNIISKRILFIRTGRIRNLWANAFRAALGFEFLPRQTTSASWGRTAYRFGGYYYSTYYYLNGTGINEIGITGGIGIPLSYTGKMDVGFQLATRGTTNSSLQKDTIVRMNIALSVTELWFFKYEDPDQ